MRKVVALILMLVVAHVALAQCERYGFVTLTGCDSVEWHGRQFYQSRSNLMDTVEAYDGCDSIVVVRVEVSPSVHADLDTSVCDRLWLFGESYEHDLDSALLLGHTRYGCDSLLHLHLTLRHTNDYDTNITACDTYRWENAVFTTSQDYTATPLTNREGCDSNNHLHITILYSSHRDTAASVCDSLTWRGHTISTAGTHTHTLTAANGCDSVLHLNLTINASRHDHDSVAACDFYRWHDSLYRSAGIYIDTLAPTAYGCLHTETLHLSLHYSSEVWIDTTVCDSIAWHANFYTSSVSDRTFETTNRAGCDSIEHFTVRVRHSTSTNHTVVACDTYQWHDSTFTVSTIYEHHALNAEGCDSLSTLNLTLLSSDTTMTDTTVCDSFLWHDSIYTASTIDTFVINNADCYGMDVLHLRVGYNSSVQTVLDVCDSVVWNDSIYRFSTSASHTATTAEGCDSVVNAVIIVRASTEAVEEAMGCEHYVWHSRLFTHATDSAHFDTINAEGCDSITYLHLTLRGRIRATDTIKACDSARYNGRIYVSTTAVDSTHSTTADLCDSTTVIVLSIRYSGGHATTNAQSCGVYRYHDTILLDRDTTMTSLFADDHGCLYSETLHLAVHHDSIQRDSIHVCNQFLWGGRTLTYDTVIVEHDTTPYGCRFDRTMIFSVGYDHERVIDTTVCDSMTFNGVLYDHSVNNAIFSEDNATGCSDITRLSIRIVSGSGDSTIAGCSSVAWRGNVYIASADIADTVHGEGVCDSVRTIHIVVNHQVHNAIDTHACGLLIWGPRQRVINHTTTFADTIHLANGCDSIDHVSVNIDTVQIFHTEVIANDMYRWEGETYTVSGEYTKTYSSVSGCDSIRVLHLVIADMPVPDLINRDDRLLMVNHYPYGDGGRRVDYYAYRWYKNGEIIAGATGDTYSNVTNTTLNGCFFVEVAVDEQREMWLRSNVVCIGTHGIAAVGQDGATLAVAPNPLPMGSPLHITLGGMTHTQTTRLAIKDIYGRTVAEYPITDNHTTINPTLPAGCYFLHLKTTQSQPATVRLIVK